MTIKLTFKPLGQNKKKDVMFLVFFPHYRANSDDNLFLTSEIILFLMEYKQLLFYTMFLCGNMALYTVTLQRQNEKKYKCVFLTYSKVW